VSGVPWLLITGSGLDDWMHWHNYNQLYQITINDCLRLVPFLTGIRVCSLLLWLTWFWFRNRSLLQHPLSAGKHSAAEDSTTLTNDSEWIHEWTPFITRGEPKRDHHLEQFICYYLFHPLLRNVLVARGCLAMDYSVTIWIWDITYFHIYGDVCEYIVKESRWGY
jgi:hypothetical protein